jgi:hypothetical protein
LVNLVYTISSTNNGEQHTNNNNNITRYLEANKNRLLDLAEKNYKNIVEALTNNAIANASSNPTLSLLSSSSSTFSPPSDQNDTYRIEKSESFHNSKGDIAD